MIKYIKGYIAYYKEWHRKPDYEDQLTEFGEEAYWVHMPLGNAFVTKTPLLNPIQYYLNCKQNEQWIQAAKDLKAAVAKDNYIYQSAYAKHLISLNNKG